MSTLTKISVVILVVLVLLACPVFITMATILPHYKDLYEAKSKENRILAMNLEAKELAIRQLAETKKADTARNESMQAENTAELNKAHAEAAALKAEKAQLEDKLNQMNAELAKLAASDKRHADQMDVLTKQVADVRDSRDKLAEENRRLMEDGKQAMLQRDRQEALAKRYQEQLAESRDREKDLQKRLEAAKSGGGTAAGAPSAAQPAPAGTGNITGTIDEVKGDVASINIGSAKGIRQGMRLIVYRGDTFVGYLQVAEVGLEDAAGFVDGKLAAKVGDRVTDKLLTNVD